MNRRCERCLRHLKSTNMDTVCSWCDLKQAKAESAAEAKVIEIHAKKYKCKLCNDGLPLSRRLYCVSCGGGPDERSAEDPYEESINAIDEYSGEHVWKSAQS